MRQKYEVEEKESQQKIQDLEQELNKVTDLQTKLEREQLSHKTLKKNADADKKLWKLEKEQLLSKMPKVK